MTPIAKYFNGEKVESYVFISLGIVALLVAFYFFFTLKTPFWKGVAIPIAIAALLELIVGYTIINRSPKDIERVENYTLQEPHKIKAVEMPRMEKVMRNFVIFRYAEILLVMVGICLMYSSMKSGFWQGLGLGVFTQASIVLCLDFFAERRGNTYFEYLKLAASIL